MGGTGLCDSVESGLEGGERALDALSATEIDIIPLSFDATGCGMLLVLLRTMLSSSSPIGVRFLFLDPYEDSSHELNLTLVGVLSGGGLRALDDGGGGSANASVDLGSIDGLGPGCWRWPNSVGIEEGRLCAWNFCNNRAFSKLRTSHPTFSRSELRFVSLVSD